MTYRYYKLNFFFFLILVATSLVFFSFSACSNGGSEFSGTAQTSITARNLPSSISSITLTISGEGMETIVEEVDPLETSFTVELEAGTGRLFELEITPSAGPGVFLKYSGSATTDLIAGETADVEIAMEVSEMRIVIPDADYYTWDGGGRIVQVDDMTGANWLELEGLDLGFSMETDFVPWDVDFDSQGRIYIANNVGGGTTPKVIRIDSFQDTTYDIIVSAADVSNDGVRAIAVDRENNYIYYSISNNNPIYRKLIGPPLGSQESFDIQAEPTITNFGTNGFSVDPDGYLYITNINGVYEVYKYDPSIASPPRIIASYSTNLSYPWDTLVFGDNIIVSNFNGADGYRIIVLDKNLNLVNNFGNNPADPLNPTEGDFYGPGRFVAILNKRITLTNEAGGPPFYDQLVSFDDINGNDWTTYGSSGSGVGQFYFFSAH